MWQHVVLCVLSFARRALELERERESERERDKPVTPHLKKKITPLHLIQRERQTRCTSPNKKK